MVSEVLRANNHPNARQRILTPALLTLHRSGQLAAANSNFIGLTLETRPDAELASRAASFLRMANEHDMPLISLRESAEGRRAISETMAREKVRSDGHRVRVRPGPVHGLATTVAALATSITVTSPSQVSRTGWRLRASRECRFTRARTQHPPQVPTPWLRTEAEYERYLAVSAQSEGG